MVMQRVGLYPGTFDPMTIGHVDITGRAMKLVDKLIMGVAIAEAKGPMFTLEERVAMITEECEPLLAANPNVEIEVKPFDNLLVQFAEDIGATMIIRGLRAVSDFEYEFQMVGMNHKLNPDIETVFLMAEASHQAVASSLVKEIAKMGGDISHFVSPSVRDRFEAKLKKRS